MRARLLAALLAGLAGLVGCAPAVSNLPRTLDDDLERPRVVDPSGPNPSPGGGTAPAASDATREPPRIVAAPGKGLRSGTIARSVSVLQLRCFVWTNVHVSRRSSFLKIRFVG